jgi:hypothetical protein
MALRRGFRIALWTAGGLMLVIAVTVTVLVLRFKPVARDYIISTLKEHYRSDVELGGLEISLFPAVHAGLDHLVLRRPNQKSQPPLISIRRLSFDTGFTDFFQYPKRIRHVRLEGLEINVPPKSKQPEQSQAGGSPNIAFLLDEVTADGTLLKTLPQDPKKQPLVFAIKQLTLHSVGRGTPMTFHAELNNAKPPGFIHSDGRFGPWNPDEPGDTPVSGDYTFANADLSVFKGITGILSSSGNYQGQLDRIEVHGTTDVPQFALTLANHPIHLRTSFEATVDGTDGDTVLHPVRALLDDSPFEVSGAIERGALETHKEINLTAVARHAQIQDFLRLAVSAPRPPMTGLIHFDTRVKIPPGETPVVTRLQLDGSFGLNGVKFTGPDVQAKIASLSHHAQGDPKNTETNDVAAEFAGRFQLRSGTLTLPRLNFEVPGAKVRLSGTYELQSGDIDMKGTARLDATISQMATGIKSKLLRPIDPLFRKNGAGASVPITISGTRGSPSFKLDIGRVLSRF